MAAIFQAFFSVLDLAIGLFVFVIFMNALLSFLIAYDFMKLKNAKIKQLKHILHDLTYPFLEKIRQHVPIIAGVDFSPVIAILILVFIQKLLRLYGLSV